MESFGGTLGKLLKERDISASELTKRLGMRSKTTLQRILRDQSNHATVSRFWDQLLQSGAMSISADERQRMEQLLEILRVGRDAYRSHRALQMLLHHQNQKSEPIFVQGIEGVSTFADLTARYSAARSLEITIIGLCDARIFQSLRDMLNRMPPDRRPRIEHSIFRIAGASETIHNVHAIFPVLFYRNYIARMVPISADDSERCFPGEMLLCRYTDDAGAVYHHQLAMSAPSQMHAIAYPDSAAYDYWRSLIRACGHDLPPLKVSFGEEYSPDDYLAYVESIRQLELYRNLYMLKPDIPIPFVPADILFAAVTSGDGAPFLPQEQLEPLRACHELRYRHIFQRRKVTHIIFSQGAMLKFAKTGRQTDHFFGARPYTPQERVAILSNCLEHSVNNPYFNVHFSRDDLLIQHAEVSCYEGQGTILVNAHTSYNLNGDHAEALITHDGFNQQFRHYYVNELLRHHVLPSAESHAYLRSLIDVARKAE